MDLVRRVLSLGLALSLVAGASADSTDAPAGVGIQHKAVGCIVAEEYPRLDACFAPSERLGRAQVQFRRSNTGPWYAVDMKADGPCFSAWLPKPKRETTSIDYFVLALDKQFAESQRPEKAPAEPYVPRVVLKKADCDPLKALAAWSSKTAPRILVNVVRDAGGKVLSATEAAGQAAASGGIAGFSSEGVVVSNAGTSGGTVSAGAAPASSGGHGHIGALAVVGGLALAGGAVAVAAGGGGSSSGTGSSSSGSNSSSGPVSTPPPANPLSGIWSGAAGSAGYTIQLVFDRDRGFCEWTSDVSVNFTQNGTSLAGPATFTAHPVNCSPGGLAKNVRDLAPPPADTLIATLSPPNGISMSTSWLPVAGTYSSTTISMKGSQKLGEDTMNITFKVRKQ